MIYPSHTIVNRYTKAALAVTIFAIAFCVAADDAESARSQPPPAQLKQTVVGTQLLVTRGGAGGLAIGDVAEIVDIRSVQLFPGVPYMLVGVRPDALPAGEFYMPVVRVKTGSRAGTTMLMPQTLAVDAHSATLEYLPYYRGSVRRIPDFLPVPRKPPEWLDLSTVQPEVERLLPQEDLIKALESPETDWETRFYAVRTLASRFAGEPLAQRAIGKAVGDPRREIREQAYLGVRGVLGSPTIRLDRLEAIAPVLIEQLKLHPEQASVVESIRSAGSRGGPWIVPELVKLIEPPFTQPVAASAASILCNFPSHAKAHYDLLMQAAEAGNHWALQAAFAADREKTLRDMTAQLRSDLPAVRRFAADSIFLLGPIKPLAIVPQDQLPVEIRQGTASALIDCIRTGDAATIRPCIRALPWFDELALPAIPVLKAIDVQKYKDLTADEVQDVIQRILSAVGVQ